MSEFINEFGKENFIIIIVVVGIIVLALIVILIIEKLQLKSKMKKQMQRQILNIDNAINSVNDNTFNNVHNTNNNDNSYNTNNYSNTNNISNTSNDINTNTNDITYNDSYKNEIIHNNETIYNNENTNSISTNTDSNFNTNNNISHENFNYADNSQEVVYVENTNSEQDAKEKLEEVTKKLIDKEDDLIDHTHFEVEQEEKSIISYDELIRASHDIDSKNDKLLIDEGEAAITLEELYKKHEDEQNIISEEKPVKVNNPVFEEEPRKFKNSEVISPVFGFYNGKVKKSSNDVLKDVNKNISSKELEEEIQETEDFLLELRKLKSKLD